jgi:radical SAM protein with 4Fe4S-binding SPASM domain
MINIEILKKRVNQARDILDNVRIDISTNGDFINYNNLDGLNLNRLHIMDYDMKGINYWKNKLMDSGCGILDVIECKSKILATHKDATKVIVIYNWPENKEIEDRAGIITEDIFYEDKESNKKRKVKYKNNRDNRSVKCYEPFINISINYLGEVNPCCHIRTELEEFEDMSFGNVFKNTVYEIFYSKKANRFRDKLRKDVSEYPDMCKRCNKIRYKKDDSIIEHFDNHLKKIENGEYDG